MVTVRAADLSEGTIIVINRRDIYLKEEDSATSNVPWAGMGTMWAIADEQIDPLLELGATVLRHGYGEDQR